MPVSPGDLHIANVSNGGIVHFGGSTRISPMNTGKSYGGHGAFGIGDFHIHLQFHSGTGSIVSDPDTNDSEITAGG